MFSPAVSPINWNRTVSEAFSLETGGTSSLGMRSRAVVQLAAVSIVLLLTWELLIGSSVVQKGARSVFAKTPAEKKCGLSRVCPSDRFALYVRSGAADVVGPQICFEGKTIMSHVFNNVGPGLNVVVVNGESGVVDKLGSLNMIDGKPGEIMRFLRQIKPGMIVLAASFVDVTPKMTTEMRELLMGMGSALISAVGPRDSWVFVGRAGAANGSRFEKRAANDEKNNLYEGWPARVEVTGCFPRTEADAGGG